MTAANTSKKSVRVRGTDPQPVVSCRIIAGDRPCPLEQGLTCAGCANLILLPPVRS